MAFAATLISKKKNKLHGLEFLYPEDYNKFRLQEFDITSSSPEFQVLRVTCKTAR